MARPATHVVGRGLGALVSLLALPPLTLALACGGGAIVDPRGTVREYEGALRRGDARAVHALLTAEARRAYGEEGTKRLMEDGKQELLGCAAAVAEKSAT